MLTKFNDPNIEERPPCIVFATIKTWLVPSPLSCMVPCHDGGGGHLFSSRRL